MVYSYVAEVVVVVVAVFFGVMCGIWVREVCDFHCELNYSYSHLALPHRHYHHRCLTFALQHPKHCRYSMMMRMLPWMNRQMKWKQYLREHYSNFYNFSLFVQRCCHLLWKGVVVVEVVVVGLVELVDDGC